MGLPPFSQLEVKRAVSGFSLVEAVMCIACLAIIGLGLGNTMISGIKMRLIANSEIRQQAVLSQLLRSMRSDLRKNIQNITVNNKINLRIEYLDDNNLPNVIVYRYNAEDGLVRRMVNDDDSLQVPFPSLSERVNFGLRVSCGDPCFEYDSDTHLVTMHLEKVQDISTLNTTGRQTAQWKNFQMQDGNVQFKVMNGVEYN